MERTIRLCSLVWSDKLGRHIPRSIIVATTAFDDTDQVLKWYWSEADGLYLSDDDLDTLLIETVETLPEYNQWEERKLVL